MGKNEIKIEDLSLYNDFILIFSATNSRFSGTVETYCSRKKFSSFANELQNFPNSLNHIVVLEIGEDHKTYDYLLIKAFVEDSVGHSILFFIISNSNIGRTEITMYLEPASINDIGRQLSLWINDSKKGFIWND